MWRNTSNNHLTFLLVSYCISKYVGDHHSGVFLLVMYAKLAFGVFIILGILGLEGWAGIALTILPPARRHSQKQNVAMFSQVRDRQLI